MRKTLLALLALGVVLNASFAFAQTRETCYSYCMGWKTYWNNDSVWDGINGECGPQAISEALKAFKVSKAAVSEGFAAGRAIENLYCSEYVQAAMESHAELCNASCTINPWLYGPDLKVSYDNGEQGLDAVWYDEATGRVGITIQNAGTGYAEGILVQVFAGSTEAADCNVSQWKKISEYMIAELAPKKAKRNSEGIPYYHTREVAWEPEGGKCNKVRVVADPNNEIPELGEPGIVGGDNEYVLIVDEILGSPRYGIEGEHYSLMGNSTDDVHVEFGIANYKTESAQLEVQVKKCTGGAVLFSETLELGAGEASVVETELPNMFWLDEYTLQKTRCVVLVAGDGESFARIRMYPSIYSGTIEGAVFDRLGNPVEGAIVSLGNGRETISGSGGIYLFRGIMETGTYHLSAQAPGGGETGGAEVELRLGEGESYWDGLVHYGVDIVLVEETGSVRIGCPVGEYAYELSFGNFTYSGASQGQGIIIENMAPGEYGAVFSKEGYSAESSLAIVAGGAVSSLDCGLEPLGETGRHEAFEGGAGTAAAPKTGILEGIIDAIISFFRGIFG
ncbi:carboxypeptidase regulatory-like domain-containing protein [Candidatus Micrarchaeota archaeon]|nr:carboxypeptidase regulatory-like domain-containing protein [Candidatus Micrarchaeota archaeon]